MRIWLDASCWVAAAGSPTGGSSLILKLAASGKIEIASSPLILDEAKRNILDHFGSEPLARHEAAVGSLPLYFVDNPTFEEEAAWDGIVAEKDRHVLAGALKAEVNALVTLDRKHLLTDSVITYFPIPAMDTRAFLVELLSNDATE